MRILPCLNLACCAVRCDMISLLAKKKKQQMVQIVRTKENHSPTKKPFTNAPFGASCGHHALCQCNDRCRLSMPKNNGGFVNTGIVDVDGAKAQAPSHPGTPLPMRCWVHICTHENPLAHAAIGVDCVHTRNLIADAAPGVDLVHTEGPAPMR